MATYVLVHGAWGGSWGFRHVRRLLQAGGHEVFTPSLTGIGEREHLTGPQVTLSTHIADVVNTVLYEDLDDIILLGFSYGGAVVTGAMEHLAGRVAQLVYLDAFVPGDGESIAALTGFTSAQPLGPGAVWSSPPRPRDFEDPAEAAFAESRRSDQPLGTFREAVRVPTPLEDLGIPLAYIKATGEPREETEGPFWDADDHAQASPAWRRYEIATNHMIPNNRPAELAAILVDLLA